MSSQEHTTDTTDRQQSHRRPDSPDHPDHPAVRDLRAQDRTTPDHYRGDLEQHHQGRITMLEERLDELEEELAECLRAVNQDEQEPDRIDEIREEIDECHQQHREHTEALRRIGQ